MSVASLVLGILSVLLAFVPFCGMFSLLPAAIGLILGIVGAITAKPDPLNPNLPKPGKGMAIAGSILSGVAILVCIAWTMFFATGVTALAKGVKEEIDKNIASQPVGNQALYHKDASAVGKVYDFRGKVMAVISPTQLRIDANIADTFVVTFSESVPVVEFQAISFTGKISKVGKAFGEQHEIIDATLK